MEKEIKDTEIKEKEVQEEVKEPKTYTAEEVEKKLQSEADRRVSQALETAKEKWKQEYEAKIEKEKEQAKRLAELSAEEKEAELLKIKEEEISAREKKLQRKELELEAVNVLADKDLPVAFVSLLVGEDAETTQQNINKFAEEWNKAIQEEMKKKVSASQFKRSSDGKGMDLGKQLAQATKTVEKKHNWFK